MNITIKYTFTRDGVEMEKTATLCAPSTEHAVAYLLEASHNAPHHEIEILDYEVLNIA